MRWMSTDHRARPPRRAREQRPSRREGAWRSTCDAISTAAHTTSAHASSLVGLRRRPELRLRLDVRPRAGGAAPVSSGPGRFVFSNLEPAPASRLCRRCRRSSIASTRSTAERKSTRKVDHAALETLSQRGITKEERKSMRELVKWSESNQAQPPAPHAQSVAARGRPHRRLRLRMKTLGCVGSWRSTRSRSTR